MLENGDGVLKVSRGDMERVRLYKGDCIDVMRGFEDKCIDLIVTSPPYDDLRSYKNTCEWNFDVFKSIANELYRITKDGGVVVWVVGDATIDGNETGTSFRQALYFKDIGFRLHDTMIYEKNSSAFPARRDSKRYTQIFEYMFILTKGKIRDDIKLLCDKSNKWAGHTNWGNNTQYDKDGNLVATNNIKPCPDFSLRNNIWKYSVGFNDKTNHPAVFPEQLALDHILSWSNEGDVVLDCFMGSGTTGKMALKANRKFIGIEKVDEYFEVAKERIWKEVQMLSLF